uniref:Uncharacterized protein n=1 Tax=Chenopodium quinoa TaxID=63459 RepID=A0A803KYB1_CHEQI
MGNCQATQVTAAVVVQHPGKDGKVDKMYLSVQANEVMRSNPGHYVALVVESPNVSGNVVVKQLKLLKPTDMLHIGHVYRLITFEGF